MIGSATVFNIWVIGPKTLPRISNWGFKKTYIYVLCCLWLNLLLRCFKAVQRFEPLTVINEVDKHRSSWTRYYFLPIKQNSDSLLPNINDWTEAVWRIWPDCADTKSKIFTFLLFRSKKRKTSWCSFFIVWSCNKALLFSALKLSKNFSRLLPWRAFQGFNVFCSFTWKWFFSGSQPVETGAETSQFF